MQNKIAKLTIATVTAGTIVASMVVPAFAINATTPTYRDNTATKAQNLKSNTATRSNQIKDKIATRAANVKDRLSSNAADLKKNIDNRCSIVTTRINNLESKYEENRDNKIRNYNKIKTRIQELLTKVKSQGFNTTKLESELKTLESMIQKTGLDYDSFILTLEDTKEFTCGNSQGQFLAALEKSKASFAIFRKDLEDIRKFYQTTLKSDLQAVKVFLQKQNEASSSARKTLKTSPRSVPSPSTISQ